MESHDRSQSGHHEQGDHSLTKHTIKIFNNPESNFKVKINHNLNIGQSEVFTVAIDPTDKQVACGTGDGVVKIFDLANPDLRSQKMVKIKANSASLGKLEEPVTSLKWKKHLANVDEEVNDFKIGIHQTTQEETEKSKTGVQAPKQTAYRNILAVSTDGSFKELSTQYQRNAFQRIDSPGNQLFTIDINQKGTHFATAGKDGNIRLYDASTRELVHCMKESKEFPGHSNRV